MSALLSLLIVSCVMLAVLANEMPGRMVAFSKDFTGSQYITKSMTVNGVSQSLAQSPAEVMVLLTAPGSKSCSGHAWMNSAMNGVDSQVFQYVYADADKKVEMDEVLQSLAQQSKIVQMTPSELASALEKDNTLLSNGAADIISMSLPATQNNEEHEAFIRALRALHSATDKKVVVLAIDALPQSSKPTQHAHYSRVLTDSTDTVTYGSATYSPEGAEYAIYYSGQYLYITPDIFTGIMTGLFVFFAIYIGISCLGSIQGMTSFYDKLPAVGKEA